MSAPFTASNGWDVEVNITNHAVISAVVDPDGRGPSKMNLNRDALRALVEYASTIGITTEAKAPVRKRARHFAPYGSRNATCGEVIPRGAVPPIAGNSGIYSSPRFTTRRAETTCPGCRTIANITDEEASA